MPVSDPEEAEQENITSDETALREAKRKKKLLKLKKEFKLAVQFVMGTEGRTDPRVTQVVQLGFYAFYKQATVGACKDPAPSLFAPRKRLMWTAWSRLGDMKKTAAMRGYIKKLTKLEPEWKAQLNNQNSSKL